jgi:hypothetical protein
LVSIREDEEEEGDEEEEEENEGTDGGKRGEREALCLLAMCFFLRSFGFLLFSIFFKSFSITAFCPLMSK